MTATGEAQPPRSGKFHSERSNYLVMLNNFATDLDILLSDLSQSCSVTNPPNLSPLKLGASKKDTASHLQESHYDHCPVITETSPTNNCRITPICIEQETRPISFWERLEKSRSIWCLPDIGRIGAVHFLKDGIPGMFIVRQSTQKSSMALSVHLSQSDGPVVEHYLIEDYNVSPHLQGSDKTFNNVPELIYNYCKNLEDLPQLLVLPDPILKAETSQKLTSLALLGQAFWTSDIMKKSISAQKNKAEKCSLHKSLSEPTSMSSKALNGNKLGQVPPHNSTNTIPVGSTAIRLSPNHKTKPLTNYKNKSTCCNAGCCKSKSKTSCSDSHLVTSCVSKTNQHQHSDDSSREGSIVNMKVHRSHTHPQINTLDLPQTDLQPGPSIDHLSVPQYFHSNLSDKLSDYEDVWKNSPSVKSADIDGSRMFSDSEAENNCTLYIPKKSVDLKTEQLAVNPIGCVSSEKQKEGLYAKSSHDVSFKHKKDIEDLYSKSAHDICFKLNIVSSADKCENPTGKTQHSAVTWPSQSTPSIHVEGRLVRRGSTGQTVQYSNKTCLAETCQKGVDMQKRNSLQETSSLMPEIPKCNEDMTGSVISSDKTDKPSNKFSEKTKPPPLHNVPYVQKSSDGKTKSPVYTEPFDSIGVNSVIFPPVSSANKQVYGQKSTSHNVRERRKNRISHQPTLETIYSPSVTPNTTIFSFDKYKIKNGKSSSDMNNNANQIHCCYSQNENHKKTDKIELKYSDKGALHNACSKVADNIFLTMNMHESKSNSQTLHKFPVNPKIAAKETEPNFTTLEDLISPQLTLKPMEQPNLIISSKTSEYDNLNQYRAVSVISDAGTVFSKPWDSEKWDNILKCDDLSALPLANPFERIQEWQELSQNYTQNTKGTANFQNRHSMTSNSSLVESAPLPDSVKAQMLENKVLKELIAKAEDKETLPVLTPKEPFEKHFELTLNKSPGMNLKEYILHLANSSDTFGLQIKHFVECTKESHETNPRCVMSNVRQFMTGIKNYLFHNNQKGLNTLIKRESSRLGANEILNIDAIIESSLHECVILPLKQHIYQLLATDYTKNGSVETLYKNIVYARTRPLSDLGLRGNLSPPGKEDLQLIRHHLTQIKLAYSPVKKLENLMTAANCITNCLNSQCPDGRGSSSVQTDDFLPMLTYVIVDVGLVTAEIEADYMWGLLHSSQVTAEANYYLSTLSSAVLLLKIFKETHQTNSSNGHQGRLPSISDMQGFLKVAFPDEFRDSIIWKTLPIRPNMTTKDVCAMIAHRFRITNPQDYGLFILVNGQEKFLAETTCPQNIKMENADAKQECIFAYKRIAAKIAWPHQWQTS